MYHGYIEDVEYGQSQSSNQPMLTWTIRFVDSDDKERTLRYYTSFGGDSAGRTKAFLAKMDPEIDLSEFRPGDAAEHFADMQVKIRVTIRRDREDRTLKRNNIADVWPEDDPEYLED